MARSTVYNAVGNVTQVTEGGVTTSYTYDSIDQLLSETRSGYSCAYTYDANGNRATRTLNGLVETYTCDSADKLTGVTWTGGSKTYGYDAAGRTTSVTTSAGVTSLAYDYEGRVTGIPYPKGGTNSFSYNGLDARTSMTDSAGSKTFKRNGIGVTSSVLSDGLANFTPGLSERRGGASTFMHSGIKNANAQTSSSQTVSATNQYDAFGNLCSSTGTWKGPFGYGGGFGYQSDADSGLKLLGHRYYDSSTGRFLSRDPARDGRNWFSYCENCPVLSSDPAGLAVFLGIKASIYAGFFGLDLDFGININSDGSKSWQAHATGGVGLGLEAGFSPTIAVTEDQEDAAFSGMLGGGGLSASIGPVDLHANGTKQGRASLGISPIQEGLSAKIDLLSYVWQTEPIHPSYQPYLTDWHTLLPDSDKIRRLYGPSTIYRLGGPR